MSGTVPDGYRFAIERQPLSRPFHFKGGFFTEKWINLVRLKTESGSVAAPGGNAVLWSDPELFSSLSEAGGNALMSLVAEHAAGAFCREPAADPVSVFRAVYPSLHELACRIADRRLTGTFTLNAMVAADLAFWKLQGVVRRTKRWIDLVPEAQRKAFDARASSVTRIPLLSYNVGDDEILKLAEDGHRIFKIKIGHAGSQEEMLERDCRRLSSVHTLVSGSGLPIRYYLDANGRYRSLDAVLRLLDYADRAGMLDRIILLEEPFPYEARIAVTEIPVRVAADESLHGADDLAERIDLGYGAVALKPAGKTLSQSVLLAAEAIRHGLACFVADSACVPALLAWNLLFAAHLPPFPGLGTVLMESNGAQNYADWDRLVAELPGSEAWIRPVRGEWRLDDEFFASSGGIFEPIGHYEGLVPG
jgi:L-alanine-DL-glutamate epimerase-like enolase superfamily enzyme